MAQDILLEARKRQRRAIQLTRSLFFRLQCCRKNDMTVGLEIQNLEFILRNLLQADIDKLRNLRVKELVNFDCWAATVKPGGFLNLFLHWFFQRFAVVFDCHECSSAGFRDLHNTVKNPQAMPQLTDFINQLMKDISQLWSNKQTYVFLC